MSGCPLPSLEANDTWLFPGSLCAARLPALFSWPFADLPPGFLPARLPCCRRTQQCFAVKAGVDGFLDVARQTFCRVTEQARDGTLAMHACWNLHGVHHGWRYEVPTAGVCCTRLQVHELANQLRQQHRLPAMRVHYTAKKGFYFILSAGGEGVGAAGGRGGRGGRGRQRKPWELEQGGDGGEEEDSETQSTAAGTGKHGGRGGRGRQQQQQHVRVPAGFSVLLHSGRSAQVTTAELNALNQRLRDASNDCVVLTEQVLEALSARVAAHFLPLLHRLVDAVALLDMLAGFARVAGSEGRSYVRPVLTEAGPLVIVEGRHAVLECLGGDSGTPWQPNDTYLALNSSFHIITGVAGVQGRQAGESWEGSCKRVCEVETQRSACWRQQGAMLAATPRPAALPG